MLLAAPPPTGASSSKPWSVDRAVQLYKCFDHKSFHIAPADANTKEFSLTLKQHASPASHVQQPQGWMTTAKVQKLISSLAQFPEITTLDIGNVLHNFPCEARDALVEFLASDKSPVRHLHLEVPMAGEQRLTKVHFFQCLLTGSIQSLHLEDCGTGRPGEANNSCLNGIAKALQAGSTLERLDLVIKRSGMDLTPLLHVLSDPPVTLKLTSLSLTHNMLCNLSKESKEGLIDMIKSNQSPLTTLKLQVSLKPEQVTRLFQAVANNQHLESLDLVLLMDQSKTLYARNWKVYQDLAAVLPSVSTSFRRLSLEVRYATRCPPMPSNIEAIKSNLLEALKQNTSLESLELGLPESLCRCGGSMVWGGSFLDDIESLCQRNRLYKKVVSGLAPSLAATTKKKNDPTTVLISSYPPEGASRKSLKATYRSFMPVCGGGKSSGLN